MVVCLYFKDGRGLVCTSGGLDIACDLDILKVDEINEERPRGRDELTFFFRFNVWSMFMYRGCLVCSF